MNKLDNKTIEELLNIKDEYDRAYQLVSILFKDKTDKEGEPYINHLIRVSSKLSNKDTKIAGLLHDTIEDIEGFTLNDLKSLNFNEQIVNIVDIVTNKNKNKPYHEFITKIIESNNDEAIKLKYADISDNSNQERLSKLDLITRTRLNKKYQKELIRLEKILKERGEKL